MPFFQRTLATDISCTGIGLHTGKKIHMRISPLRPNSGIRFCRTDLPTRPCIQARQENVVDTRLATTLGGDGHIVSTVEHLLSAFAGLGIDNAMVELDGPEVPIMDGSAGPFVYLLRSAGIQMQSEPKRFLLIKKPFSLQDGDKKIAVYPGHELKITYSIDFDHPLLSGQKLVFRFSGQTYTKEICRARTFGFLRDVETLKQNGYARGGSLDNAIVLDDYRVLNADGLRYQDEFVRHKVLDLIGDLSLVGMPIIGHIVAHRSGHSLNHSFLTGLLAKRKCWKAIRFKEKNSHHPLQVKVPSFAAPQPVPL